MLRGLKGFIKTNEKVTHEGGRGYELTLEESVAELFSLGLVKGNFYQDDLQVIENTRELMKKAFAECPQWAAKCAVYGHNFNSLKLVPVIWLVYLSKLDDKTLFERAFPKIIRNPKMLHDFLELVRKGGIRQGMGRSVKRAVNSWLNDRLNDYHATRYKGKLVQVIKTARPIAAERIQPFIDYIINDREDAFPRAKALKSVLQALKAGRVDARVLAAIKANRLQLEELKHAFGSLAQHQKKAVLEFMLPSLKYNALVSNLVTIERVFATETQRVKKTNEHGTFVQEQVIKTDVPVELVDRVAQRLSDPDSYRKSGMLPFGLITAGGMTLIQAWKEAIDHMLQKCVRTVFDIPANSQIRIGVDTSGSMALKVTPSLTAVDIASLFGAMVAMSTRHARVFATATLTQRVPLAKNGGLFENAQRIASTDVGWGTCFEPLLDDYEGEKYVILITDGQQSDNLEAVWANLKGRPAGSKLIIWHITGYNNKISKRWDVVYLRGYSDRLLAVLKNILEGKAGQMEQIEAIIV